MARFCGSCGAEAQEDARVCGTCGAPLENNSANTTIPGLEYIDPEKKEQYKKYGIIAAGAVAAIVVIVILFNIITSFVGYKGAIRRYFRALNKENASSMAKLMPEYEIKRQEKRDDDFDLEEYIDDNLFSNFDYLEDEYGNNIKFSYDIKDSKTLSDKKLKKIKKSIESSLDYSDVKYDVDNITKAVEVELEVKIKGDDDKDEDDVELTLIKENGSWKLYEGGLF